MKLKENVQIQIQSSGKARKLKDIDLYQFILAYEFISKEFEVLPYFLCLGQRASPCLYAAGEHLMTTSRDPSHYTVCGFPRVPVLTNVSLSREQRFS